MMVDGIRLETEKLQRKGKLFFLLLLFIRVKRKAPLIRKPKMISINSSPLDTGRAQKETKTAKKIAQKADRKTLNSFVIAP
jgi:hypothetical protein